MFHNMEIVFSVHYGVLKLVTRSNISVQSSIVIHDINPDLGNFSVPFFSICHLSDISDEEKRKSLASVSFGETGCHPVLSTVPFKKTIPNRLLIIIKKVRFIESNPI